MILRKPLLSWKSNIVPLEYTYCVFLQPIILLLLQAINTQRNVARSLQEIANA